MCNRIPALPTPFNWRRKNKIIWNWWIAANIIGSCKSFGGSFLYNINAGFFTIQKAIIIQQIFQFFMPVACISDLPFFFIFFFLYFFFNKVFFFLSLFFFSQTILFVPNVFLNQ